MEIGDILKQAREKNKLTLKALSKISGVGQSTISDIENGLSKNPRRDTLSKLANALGISVNDFFVQEDESPKSQNLDKNEPLKLGIIPKEFTDPLLAREYISKHQIFGAHGFDPDKLDDSEILEFANELLKQMEMVSFKYKK